LPPVFLHLNPSLRPNEPLIIAHRGASALAPENTLAAFARAFKDDADGLELDVHLARDGVPVVIHDSNLGRTGPSMGDVAEITSKQLSQVDVGGWFNRAKPALAREEYSFQHVPTFAEVIQLVKTIPTTARRPKIIYVEMKTTRDSSVTRNLAQAVIRLVKDHDLCKQAIIISFDLKAVTLAKQINSSIRTGALFHPRTVVSQRHGKRLMITSALDCGTDEILLHRLFASRATVELAVENNLLPVVWTVDHSAWMRRAKSWGIHALITNDPAKLKAATR